MNKTEGNYISCGPVFGEHVICLGTLESLDNSTRLILSLSIKAFKFDRNFMIIFLGSSPIQNKLNPRARTTTPREGQFALTQAKNSLKPNGDAKEIHSLYSVVERNTATEYKPLQQWLFCVILSDIKKRAENF